LEGWGTPNVPALVRTGYPLQGTSRWGYIPFSDAAFTSDSTFFVCSILVPVPYPPPIFWGGECLPGTLGGMGYPHRSGIGPDGVPPPRYLKVGVSPIFRHTFTSETKLMSSPKMAIGWGDPPGCHLSRTPPPCHSKGRGYSIGQGPWGYPAEFAPTVSLHSHAAFQRELTSYVVRLTLHLYMD